MVPRSHRALLDEPLTAILTTLGAGGMPQASAIWYLWDDERLLVSTKRWAAKFRNVTSRPAGSFIVVDPADEFRTLELRGTCTVGDDPGLVIRDRIRAKHGIGPGAPDPAAADRALITLTPTRVVIHPA